jgi:hypothetical protein
MAILVEPNMDILEYNNRKAIDLAQQLGRPLTAKEYASFKISGTKHRLPKIYNLVFKKNTYCLERN